jgi:hypothetical protein
MVRSSVAQVFVAMVAIGAGMARPAPLWAQSTADFAGRWTLNRTLSSPPREVGFSVDWAAPSGGAGSDSSSGGGRGRRGGGGGSRSGAASPFAARQESPDDAKRVQQLTAEVREPSVHLTIADTPAAITITDDRGQSRTFHPHGVDEVLQLDGVPVSVNAKREEGRLVVRYHVEEGRELRYTYSRVASPAQVVVVVQFIEHGVGDEVRRVYEPAKANETAAVDTTASSSATASPASPASRASGDRSTPETFSQGPDAELKGLTKLGIVIEELSPQAAACGLSQSALQSAVSKRLSDAGFKVLPNSDEDTYVYVNIITSSLSTGFCVSRYDAFLYTHTTAKLSYQDMPVLVEVSLLHKGGLAGAAPSAHADGVLKGLLEYVDQFSTRIHDANKPRPPQ